MTDRSITVSYFTDISDTRPTQEQISISDLMRRLTAPPILVEGPITKSNFAQYKDGPLFTVGKYKDGATRGNNGIEHVDALVLDYDGPKETPGLSPEEVEHIHSWLESTSYLYVAYNSFTSGFYSPREKLRVVLFLEQSISNGQHYKDIWHRVTDEIGVLVDSTSSQFARCYYLPRIPHVHERLYDSSCGGERLLSVSGNKKTDWIHELATTSEKHHVLVKAAYGLGAKEALSGGSASQTEASEKVWSKCREALARNTTTVIDWNAAEKTCRSQAEKGWLKGREEKLEVPEGFAATPKQIERAEKALRTQLKHIEQDYKRTKQAAYELGRYVPHVLEQERVRRELFKAATQLDKAGISGYIGAQAELEIAAGLEQGKRSPHFVFTGWRSKLLLDKEQGTIKPCEENASLFLQWHPACKDLLKFNVRRGHIYIQDTPPWMTTRTEFPCELSDYDALDCGRWLAEQGTPLTSSRTTARVMGLVGRMNEYDPFKDWLEGLSWDGIKRLDHWLACACSVKDNAYHTLVGSKWIMSAVARTLTPSCEVQHALVLCGPQGIGKSRLLKALAGATNFCSNAGELGSDEFIFNLERFVIVELAELAGFRKKEIEEIKRLLTDADENLREKYAEQSRTVLRRAILAGTTNVVDFLHDETGNRRFWPVRCEDIIDIAWIDQNRDQLWAEAHSRVLGGEAWWPTTDHEKTMCWEVQKEHLEVDDLVERLDYFLGNGSSHLLVGCPVGPEQLQPDTENRGRLQWATMAQIYAVLGLKIEERRDQFRVRRIIAIRGWRSCLKRLNGKVVKAVEIGE